MATLPPLENPQQPIRMAVEKNDTQQLGNKDVFEIMRCDDYEQQAIHFMHDIDKNDKRRDVFLEFIKCINPLSSSHRSILSKHLQDRADLIELRGWNQIKSPTIDMDATAIICYLIEYAYSDQKTAGNKRKKKNDLT